MELKRIGVLSCAKVVSLLYLMLLVPVVLLSQLLTGPGSLLGMLWTVLLYGLITGIFAAAVAAVYNFIARTFGGISLDIS